MKLLAKEISEALQKEGAYKIRAGQLSRLWPLPAEEQEREVRVFAEANGWTIQHFNYGVSAIVVREESY